MSVAFAEPVLDRPRTEVRRAAAAPSRERVRRRAPGPGVGPVARPQRLRFVAPPASRSRACSPVRPAAAAPRPQSRTWRLTERGVAVVMVVAAALVAASVVVVGLTALRVTGDGYRPGHAVSAPVLVER